MLEFQGVSLRSILITDGPLLFQAINDPQLVRYNAPYKPVSELDHNEWLKGVLKDKSKQFFIICYQGIPVGSVQLIDINFIHRNAELTIRIFDNKNASKGIGSKALQLLCEYAFKDLGLMRLWLRVFHTNERAIHVYKKAGFQEEGVMRKAAYVHGSFVDVLIMAKLRDDNF